MKVNMRIGSDLKQKDYQELIRKAKNNIPLYKSHRPCKLYILNHEIDSDIICLGIELIEYGMTITGRYIPPYMKYAFEVDFLIKDVDLVKNILDKNDVEIDDKRYYIGDYKFQNECFQLKYISYNLFEEEI